ncbi:neutral/alkaline non-lysosomal ceramidase [Tothia fuscella]|uniref:Neutral ceramidase n=1 Tax=Tothia fuscella TaxID=1048955 RepID=A0A9P4NGG9_9PEZI|nr:neutral/alkaline non-lysosomal ceramidase [Tothia fuscella]
MGYADPNQTGTGLRQRLYSRAFIIHEPGHPENSIVYLVLDTQSGDTAVRDGILTGLQELGEEYRVYGRHNVAVTGTHSHSGPGAWLNYLLPQITSKGFSKQSYDAIVTGALLSIKRAHEGLIRGTLEVGTTEIDDANINRSLYAYLANPTEELDKYNDNVDKNLTLLRFTRSDDGKDIGILTWFAVHGTSMLGNNTLITGDNKGVAAYLFEKSMVNDNNTAEGFVAGFSQANVGDTSPNVLGAYCEDGSDEECKLEDSTCGGRNEACHGRGPYYGLNDGGTKSCFEIGKRQFEGAKGLYSSMVSASSSKSAPIVGSTVRSLHIFVDLKDYTFPLPNGTYVRTCSAALGYSFAAGTSDGPGAFDFKQNDSGDPNANPLWSVVGGLVHVPTEDQKECQYPKPILLDVGESKTPYDWSPNIVDIQLLRVGSLIIVVSPGEATTMAGRRWRDAIAAGAREMNLLGDSADTEPVVLLGGPANTYTHYITTPQEYAVQRYEGASTLYGSHTLDAYINLTLTNLAFLSAKSSGKPSIGPLPPINTNRSLSFIGGVVVDRAGLWSVFGDVVTDVARAYRRGDIASAVFIGANPRNNLRLEGTYAAVEKLSSPPYLSSPASQEDGNGDELKARAETWTTVRSDDDWELVYLWKRTSEFLGTSEVTIEWEIGGDAEPGTYRLHYYGDAKSLGGEITPFEGVSGKFVVA